MARFANILLPGCCAANYPIARANTHLDFPQDVFIWLASRFTQSSCSSHLLQYYPSLQQCLFDLDMRINPDNGGYHTNSDLSDARRGCI